MPTEADDARGYRVWLVDLAGREAPVDLLTYTAYSGGFSASRDGATFVVAAGDKWDQAIYLGDTRTGRLRELVRGGVGARPSYPRISPDGTHVAWLESADRWLVTIWGGRLPDGPVVPLVVHHADERFGSDLQWSADARFLSYTVGGPSYTEAGRLKVADTLRGTVFDLGPDSYAAWHPTRHILAFSGPAFRTGARYLSLFNADTGAFTDLVREREGSEGPPFWNDAGDRLLTSEVETDPPFVGGLATVALVVRDRQRTIERYSATGWNGGMWWSRDERVVAMRYGAPDHPLPLVPLVDLVSGREIAVFCRMGGTPPSDCAHY